MSIPPPVRGFQWKLPVYPSMFTVVAVVVTGAPRLEVLFAGQSNTMAYTAFC